MAISQFFRRISAKLHFKLQVIFVGLFSTTDDGDTPSADVHSYCSARIPIRRFGQTYEKPKLFLQQGRGAPLNKALIYGESYRSRGK